MAQKLLGQVLVSLGFCKEEHVKAALAVQKQKKCLVGEALVGLGHIDREQLAKGLAKQAGVPFVNLSKGTIPQQAIDAVPKAVAEENRIVPVKVTDSQIVVASDRPIDLLILDNLRFTLNKDVTYAMTAGPHLEAALRRYYGGAGPAAGPAAASDAAKAVEDDDAPIIRLVQKTITDAVRMRASDVHVEPMVDKVRVRYRVDGLCAEIDPIPKNLQGPVISRIKIMADMDIAEKRKPQDGRIKFMVDGKHLDLRVSALPAYHGESVVMRILDREASLVSMTGLGFHEEDYKRFQRMIKRPNGILLVTGPTGSGKTTTLYAALSELNKPDKKIITAEDPVEYNLPGINQCQVRRRAGLDFARILRAMLRQAPNIILVGEIRDHETAEIAIQAALTGHLVFSTLHTNDAPSALSRLIDMGVKPFLVASAIQAIMAQRLVRRICMECREQYTPTPSELRALGMTAEQVGTHPVYRSKGCQACRNTGYKGRLGIFELFEMSSRIREMTFEKKSLVELRDEAKRSGGMITLQQDGIRKILSGVTTTEEILRITQRGDIG